MDKPLTGQHDPQASSDIITNLANHLLKYPQDIIDATRLIKNFQASVHEFTQALSLIAQTPDRHISMLRPV